jgi:hypothetical protein
MAREQEEATEQMVGRKQGRTGLRHPKGKGQGLA